MTTQTDMAVANEINKRIGGKAFYMMGTKHKLGTENSLSFDIHGCRAFSKIQITLTPLDLYNVEFFKFRQWDRVGYHIEEGIYADMLHACIERVTGLALSL